MLNCRVAGIRITMAHVRTYFDHTEYRIEFLTMEAFLFNGRLTHRWVDKTYSLDGYPRV